MASELDSYREMITQWCLDDLNNSKIESRLEEVGCTVGRERIRTWLSDETKAGRLAVRNSNRRGRPPAKKAASSPLPPPPAITKAPQSAPKTYNMASFAELFSIPVDEFGSLDFKAWAQDLGTEGVLKISHLDFFSLESLENPWCGHDEKWTKKWVDSVSKSAETLRQEMLDAAQMHHLTSSTNLEKGS